MNYKIIFIYAIFFISVYFQSYINIYDSYMDFIDHKKYDALKKDTGDLKSSINNNTAHFVGMFLRKSSIASFRLSSTIGGDDTRYSIMEEAYPVQISDKSNYLIVPSNERPNPCDLLVSKEGVKIVFCP